MKKVFLLGTMLGVASAALAFGGMFNHGSKSTTYKGGVNAIGVHFGGEKSPDSKGDATEVCAEGVLKDRFGHCNICENGNVYLSYMDDPCGTETEMEGDCVSNADCESDEFCNLQDPSWNCEKPEIGVCQKIGDKQEATINGLGDVILSSNDPENYSFTWWAADNWCKAQGKNLIKMTDLGCYISGTENLISKDTLSDYAVCCAQGQTCNWYEWENETVNYSPILIDLVQKIGRPKFWTLENGSDCSAGTVYVSGPYIIMWDIRSNNTEDGLHYALCK